MLRLSRFLAIARDRHRSVDSERRCADTPQHPTDNPQQER